MSEQNAAAVVGSIPSAEAVVEEESILIDVTKSNFFEKSNDFIEHVPKASWIAIDEEMTGIQLPDTPRPSKDDTPEARYSTLKAVPERYSLIQLGISLFQQIAPTPETAAGKPKFHVRRYKFTLFPPSDSSITREIVLSPGSVKFLAEENNCNLNEWIQQGIPFCHNDTATHLLDKFRTQQIERMAPSQAGSPNIRRGRRVELTKTQDKDFHAQTMATLREWLDAALEPSGDGAYIMLPPCNSFLRRALYESIPLEYPNLVLETVKESNQIRVWRLSQAEKKARNIRLLKEGFEGIINEKVGVWRVFMALMRACSGTRPTSQAEHMALAPNADTAMDSWQTSTSIVTSKRKIPLVVHNGLQDLFFLFTHFHAPKLPEEWADCKRLIHSYFPVVYDTKTMASEYCLRENSRARTHLAAVYEQTLLSHPQWNRIFTRDGTPESAEQFHDAGYDSYCTGAAFCGLATTISAQQHLDPNESGSAKAKIPVWGMDPNDSAAAFLYGRNKLHFHMSPYTIDLESKDDPLARGMTKASTFRISGIPPSLTTRDIVRCLSGLVDSSGNRVNFEIIWVDDTSFLVGAMIQNYSSSEEELTARFQEHAKILWTALKNRFHHETIRTLSGSDRLQQQPQATVWNLWGLFGGKNKRTRDSDSGRPNKRARTH